MRFTSTTVDGVQIIDPERHEDERGWFARTWSRDEFAERGLETNLLQCSASFSARCGTARGLHYQVPPFAEVKLVRCTRGALFDVAVDLRPDSPTLGQWVGFELTPDNGRMLYIPRGFAHGFVTLADETEVAYQMSDAYSPAHGRGARFDDPLVRVQLPVSITVMSPRDREWPDLTPGRLDELRGL
jgi:dTDP-4-dehydrorhamnose 3,5-epimerase